jgi:hypothetical protein
VKVTRSLFVQVPVWMIDRPDLTPTALRVYLALGVEALAGDVRARRAMGAVVERRGGDLFLPLDDPSATADDPTLNLTPTPSATVDKPSATVESPSTVAESESATVDSSSCKRIREPREGTSAPATADAGALVPEVVDPVHDASHRLAVVAFEQDPRPVTPFVAVMARCREALEAGWTEQQVAYVIRVGDVAAWTREALQLALNRRRQSADARRGGSPLAALVALAAEEHAP